MKKRTRAVRIIAGGIASCEGVRRVGVRGMCDECGDMGIGISKSILI